MKAFRITALVATLLIALANLPIAFTADDGDVASWLQWPATLLGVLGILAFIALLRRMDGAALFALVVGALNVLAGIIVIAQGHGSGAVGLVLGAVAALASAALLRRPAATALA
jgi:hypothetical protein